MSQLDLIGGAETAGSGLIRQVELGQYFTPAWAAEILAEKTLRDVPAGSVVVDPTCGDGAWLAAIPSHFRRVGYEIDPHVAARAQAIEGVEVICADFLSSPVTCEPQVYIGNPPFQSALIEKVIAKCFETLPRDGLTAMILPAYVFQAASTVLRICDRWRVEVELIPKTIFPRLTTPLLYVTMRKSERRELIGFALYEEVHSVNGMKSSAQRRLSESRRGTWRTVVSEAIDRMGGTVSLEALYASLEGNRPTDNRFWKDKVRQQVQMLCVPVSRGVWKRAA